jgi:hypothetical protein
MGTIATAGKNPWFLITSEEVEEIERQLQGLRSVIPAEHENQIRIISGMITDVRARQA